MKKCPVCGVEHSDIVPVCSICGSSLANAETVADAKEPVQQAESAPQAPVQEQRTTSAQTAAPDVSMEDIQAAVSSVVSSAVEGEKRAQAAPAKEESFDDDSPFVENAMKEKQEKPANAGGTSAKTEPAGRAKKQPKTVKGKTGSQTARGGQGSKQPDRKDQGESKSAPAESRRTTAAPAASASAASARTTQPTVRTRTGDRPSLDTTVVAAASAQKVRAAKENAVAARERNAQAESQNPDANGFDWSERKHKRGQSRTNTPVIVAVCALLALLIVAMIALLGKLMLGDSTEQDQPGEDSQSGVTDTLNPEEGQEGDVIQEEQPEDTDPGQENEETPALPEEDPNAEDQPEDAQEGQDQQTGEEPEGSQDEDAQQEEDTAQEQPEQPELPAIAEAEETVYATGSVRVRDYPSTQDGEVIGGLTVGQSVTRTGTTQTGWSRIQFGNAVGYVSSNYLSTTKPADTSAEDQDSQSATAIAGVNVRETPNGTVIGTLTQGQKVTLTGKKEGDWVQIQTGSLTGYVYASYLSGTGSSNDSQREEDVSLTETGDTVYATTGVNVRDYPSSSTGKVVTTLSKGQKVTRIGKTSTGWSKIKVGSVTGYVYNSYLSTSEVDDEDTGSSGTRTGYILPESNTRTYSKSELSALSSSQLRLARNEIYARHGRKFNDKSLQDYFNSCSWYSGTVDPATFDANINNYLNSYELANLQLITELE